MNSFSFLRLVRPTLILLLQSIHFNQPVKSFVITLIGEKSDYEASTDLVEYVADSYIKEQNQPRALNHLLYWKDHQCTWPILASISRRYLSAPGPPSPVASERLGKSL